MERPEGALYGAQMVPKCHNRGGIPLIYEGIHPEPTERRATVPRFNVQVSFMLDTEIDCDFGYHAFDRGEVEEFSDESYFSTQSVEADGGDLRFVVEADSEESAEEKASEVISDGMELEDSNGFTWLVSNVSFDIEEIVIPMDLLRATTLVQEFLNQMEGMDDDLKEAFGFLLDLTVSQEQRIVELGSTNAELYSEIRRLSEPEASEKLAARLLAQFNALPESDRMWHREEGESEPMTFAEWVEVESDLAEGVVSPS